MYPAVFISFTLLMISIVLVMLLMVAWTSFGRPRHALIWAIGHGLAGMEWLLTLAVGMGWLGQALAHPVVQLLGVAAATLIMVGFRQRAGLAPRWRTISVIAILCGCDAIVANLIALDGPIDRSLFPTYLAMTQIVSAMALVQRGWGASLTEQCAFVVMLICAVFYLDVGLFALVQGADATADQLAAYRALLLLGRPAIYASIGLFSVFLLAMDLAERMQGLTLLDPLTGIMNRRGFMQAAEAALANGRRSGHPLSLIIADLDRFKHINDHFGHSAGDRALQCFSAYLEGAVRKGDIVSRIGGEEFALLLVNMASDGAMEVAERLRARLARLDSGTQDVRLSASFGVADLRPQDSAFGDLFDRADAALYRSKQDGRDRVTLAEAAACAVLWPGGPDGLPEALRPREPLR